MLSSTRVALSSDADVQFLVVKLRDARLGTTITLLRHFPDIKSFYYMQISRSDFDDRLVMETGASEAEEGAARGRDITMTEYLARLMASRLTRQFSENPLVSAFLQIRRIEGTYADGR